MIISFPATVTKVFERTLSKHISGAGKEARFSTASSGWYIQIDEMISIYVGAAKPDLAEDQAVVISIRKAT